MKVELLSITPESERHIEHCGRTSYQSFDKIDIKARSEKKFIRMIRKRGHESVLEHAYATFRFSNVSRAMTHQLVRHRLVSYTQKSQRYVDETKFGFIIPDSILGSKHLFAYENYMAAAHKLYTDLVADGIPKQDARFVLPNACTTEIVVTANFRQWRHMLELRLDSHAQWEIQAVMQKVLKTLFYHAPAIFEDIMADYGDKKAFKTEDLEMVSNYGN